MEKKKIIQWLKKNVIITGAIVSVIIATPIGVYSYNSFQYNKFIDLGNKALQGEKFDDAVKYYKDALNYKKSKSSDVNKKIDSIDSVKDSKEAYDQGLKLLDEKKYIEAIEAFKKVSSNSKYFKDSQEKIAQSSNSYIMENLDLAKAEAGNKNFKGALTFLENIIKFDGTNKDALSLKDEYNKEIEKAAATTTTASTAGGDTQNSNGGNSTPTSGSVTSYTYGNTAGNIMNASSSAFDGEYIFFANKSDAYKVYKMRADFSGKIKVADVPAGRLSVLGDWIYITGGLNPGMWRIKKDGSVVTKISDENIGWANIVNDWVYYSPMISSNENYSIYKMKVDGSQKIRINFGNSNYALIDPFKYLVVGDWVYVKLFSPEDHSTLLFRVKTDGSSVKKLGKVGEFVVSNDWIYYVDNFNELKKMKVDGSGNSLVYKIENFGIYSLNISGDNIYFSADNQTSSEEFGGIYKLNMDGSGLKRLTKTWCKNFNIVSNWILYVDYSTQEMNLRKVKIDGTGESLF